MSLVSARSFEKEDQARCTVRSTNSVLASGTRNASARQSGWLVPHTVLSQAIATSIATAEHTEKKGIECSIDEMWTYSIVGSRQCPASKPNIPGHEETAPLLQPYGGNCGWKHKWAERMRYASEMVR
jgi:hypothetical protein